jgi:hypothetical protein
LASAPPRADRHTVGQQKLTRSRRLPAAVADCSFWCNSESGRTLELGRSGGTLLTSAAAGDASCGVIANSPVDTAWRGRVLAGASPRARGERARRGQSAARPARSAWSTLRLPTAVAVLFREIGRGRMMELGRSGRTMPTSAAAGGASYGVVDDGSGMVQR